MARWLWGIIFLALILVGYVIYAKAKEKPEGINSSQEAPSEVQEMGLSPVKQASERYQNPEEALKALKEASKNYDLEFIESFTLPNNCAWCGDFYEKLKHEVLTANLSSEEKSFYAEILAVSGKPESLEFLVQAYLNSKSDSDKEAFLNAIELTVANDEIIDWLAENVNRQSNDPGLRDSILAALTNQDSVKAVEHLYDILVKQEDPERDAQKGIGLSECVPPDEALPFLVDKLKDTDSRFQVYVASAILNNGLEGLKKFVDVLNSDTGNKLAVHFQKLVDHVPFDEEIEGFLKEVSEKGSEPQKVFAKKVLEAFDALRSELEQEAEGEQEENNQEQQ
ncbi:MAG: hypothetical protein NZT61_06335 [Deltaproteobacteria bacterium]|nr:hypothetical protein [Deltaproteobacteria bacterium]MCX7953349.1 hypothetical protein [Deltaproteobacteria bacterium]